MDKKPNIPSSRTVESAGLLRGISGVSTGEFVHLEKRGVNVSKVLDGLHPEQFFVEQRGGGAEVRKGDVVVNISGGNMRNR